MCVYVCKSDAVSVWSLPISTYDDRMRLHSSSSGVQHLAALPLQCISYMFAVMRRRIMCLQHDGSV